jgi:hypothetical protein
VADIADLGFLLDRFRQGGGCASQERGGDSETQHPVIPSRANIAPICAPSSSGQTKKAASLV